MPSGSGRKVERTQAARSEKEKRLSGHFHTATVRGAASSSRRQWMRESARATKGVSERPHAGSPPPAPKNTAPPRERPAQRGPRHTRKRPGIILITGSSFEEARRRTVSSAAPGAEAERCTRRRNALSELLLGAPFNERRRRDGAHELCTCSATHAEGAMKNGTRKIMHLRDKCTDLCASLVKIF